MAPDDVVSIQAHQRVATERDNLKARVSELEGMITDLGTRERAIDYFRGKGISDPVKWATIATPHIRGVATDELPAKLDELFGGLATGATQPPPTPSEEDEGRAPNPFRRPSPNPAAAGTTPSAEPIKPGSDEWKRVLREQGLEGMRKLDKEGRLGWSEENLRIQQRGR